MTFEMIGVCCREWILLPLMPIGRCGYCGQKPEVKDALPAQDSGDGEPGLD